jgi:hypothetical protein
MGAIATALIALGTSALGCWSVPEPSIPEVEPPARDLGPEGAPSPRVQQPAAPAVPEATPPPEVAPTRAVRPRAVAGHPIELYGEVPPGIQNAPYMPFGGSTAFLVRGDWYVETPAGWAWFIDEPSELRACRLVLRREDSPARHPSLGSPLRAPPGCPVR